MAVNWPGLLAWSTKYHDGTAPSEFKKMSDEDRAFLEKAMEDAFGKLTDLNVVFGEAVVQLKAADRTDESAMTALEVIDRLCDDPDIARNAEKLDGVQALLDLVKTSSGAVQARAYEILSLFFSNNPDIQEAGIRRGAMQLFMRNTKDAPQGSDDRASAFRALVALVRQLPEHERALLRSEGGAELLVALLDPAEHARTREKVGSFVTSLAMNAILSEDEVVAYAAAVARLLPGLSSEGLQHREIMSGCALELARAAPTRCADALAAPADARLGELTGAEDDVNEQAALKECLSLLK